MRGASDMFERFDRLGRHIALFYRLGNASNGGMHNTNEEKDLRTLLQIQSSLFQEHGQSSALAARFVTHWRETHRDGQVVVRDVGRDPVPHLTAERFQAFLARP